MATEFIQREPPRHRRNQQPSRVAAIAGSMPGLIVISLFIAILVKSLLVQAFFIPSESMEPTLLPGDRVFVNKLHAATEEIERGDIVVFVHVSGEEPPKESFVQRVVRWFGEGLGVAKPQNEDYIKRVIGLPGETVELHDKKVFVDGVELAEPYLTDGARDCNDDFAPVQVPAGQFFVMGDNRCNSLDSRFGLGFVPGDAIVGDAFVTIWPPNRWTGLR